MLTQFQTMTNIRGGNLIKAEKDYINRLLKITSYNRRRQLLKKATKAQLGALLQIAWNLLSHSRARLTQAQKLLLKRYYSVLHKLFFEIKRVSTLRELLLTPGLLPALLAPIKSERGIIPLAILDLLK